MPFTLVHGLISFLVIAVFTKDRRYWLLAFCAGLLPDLDGLPLLFDINLYYLLHRELFHPLIYGIVFGLLFGFVLSRWAKMDFKKSFAVFAVSFAIHPLTDVVFTDLYVRLFWPFSSQPFLYPILLPYNFELAIAAIGLSAIVIFRSVLQKKQTDEARTVKEI